MLDDEVDDDTMIGECDGEEGTPLPDLMLFAMVIGTDLLLVVTPLNVVVVGEPVLVVVVVVDGIFEEDELSGGEEDIDEIDAVDRLRFDRPF
ncbi:hypothetical protein SAMD00019534_048880 [Acytostelium subglobosum LB1]|uniref:hypothetical protein n=1 Tax=Acytostelium subglobosum LB1 TaxID=1410327 RepID=UPI0006450F1E|nr:hypothetical protein SAMD00019534_048880 [Acytostelium subglobosum LB1]GAM21713.1 hypothetical protein SAMD00019534_048880 [Acytostelium subglobosum LB1]|eukprot:XP_012755832.1 hypothetical protein SAMD00019534_048880 [Acytostelium subglobosum LB1]